MLIESFKVQNAIFKVHRSVISEYSSVFQDMLDMSKETGPIDGTAERPLVLTGDNATAWEILFGMQCNTYVLICLDTYLV
jgi:hypothetical protein